MLKNIPNLIASFSENNINYILIELYKIYIKNKFLVSPNYDIATIYYIKYSNYITSDLYNLILKIVFKGIKYLYILLDTTTK